MSEKANQCLYLQLGAWWGSCATFAGQPAHCYDQRRLLLHPRGAQKTLPIEHSVIWVFKMQLVPSGIYQTQKQPGVCTQGLEAPEGVFLPPGTCQPLSYGQPGCPGTQRAPYLRFSSWVLGTLVAEWLLISELILYSSGCQELFWRFCGVLTLIDGHSKNKIWHEW